MEHHSHSRQACPPPPRRHRAARGALPGLDVHASRSTGGVMTRRAAGMGGAARVRVCSVQACGWDRAGAGENQQRAGKRCRPPGEPCRHGGRAPRLSFVGSQQQRLSRRCTALGRDGGGRTQLEHGQHARDDRPPSPGPLPCSADTASQAPARCRRAWACGCAMAALALLPLSGCAAPGHRGVPTARAWPQWRDACSMVPLQAPYCGGSPAGAQRTPARGGRSRGGRRGWWRGTPACLLGRRWG